MNLNRSLRYTLITNAIKEFGGNALEESRRAINEADSKLWVEAITITSKILRYGTSKITKIHNGTITYDVFSRYGSIRIILAGIGHLIGLWRDNQREEKIIGYRPRDHQHYLIHKK